MGRFPSALLVLASLLWCVSGAFADGKIFPRGVAVPPPIPDQQAIIAWDAASSTETLAIETRFAAASSQSPKATASGGPSDSAYAWIVPLPGPGAPEISAASPGLFATVRAIFQPRVFDNGPDMFGPLVFLTGMLLLGTWVSMRGKNSRLGSLVSILVVLLGVTCIGGILLPTLGTARSAAPGAVAGVNVLSRSIVGSYEISVVGADRSASGVSSDRALGGWFAENGFDLPAAAAPVIVEYAVKSWVFAAVKLRPDAAASGAAYLAPHPLIFRFKTAAPVYPMRLTGVGNGPLTLDLYVFAKSRANAPGMSVVRCGECLFGESAEEGLGRWRRGGVIGIGHPVLKGIVGNNSVATKLSGRLTPGMQAADLPITWSPLEQSGGTMQSPRSARWRAAEAGLAVVPGVVVLLMIVAAIRRDDGRFVFRHLAWAAAPAIVVGAVKWMATPTVEVVEGGSRATFRVERDLEELPERVRDMVRETEVAPTIDRVRAIARGLAEERGLAIVEDDAPYGMSVRAGETPGTIDLVLRNWCGAPQVRRVWPADK